MDQTPFKAALLWRIHGEVSRGSRDVSCVVVMTALNEDYNRATEISLEQKN